MPEKLYTQSAEKIGDIPWDVYPRPQLKRDSYVNLNGLWELSVSEKSCIPQEFPHTVRVPYCPESLLSGLNTHFPDGSYLYYRRRFRLPQGFQKDRVLLHFGAADQLARVYVNQTLVGEHRGGYEAFALDITRHLQEENTLVVEIFDDLRSTVLPYGKQKINRGGMWYTPVTGLWQTVWLESVPETYIEKIDIAVKGDRAQITLTPPLDGTAIFEGREIPVEKGCVALQPENPKRWSPETPHLYAFTLKTQEDRVDSYFALREISVGQVGPWQRLLLNGKPYFFHGLLDQGYWSDGIYTPACPEDYDREILKMKALGFNTLRKHIKVEPEQFYYACDRLGMVVFQDMVNNGLYSFLRDTALPTVGLQKLKDKRFHRDEETRQAFYEGMEATVRQLKNHPCILYWTVFNEGWGQFEGTKAYHRLKKLDSSRIIDTTSGWFRGSRTDVDSHHIYFTPWAFLKAKDKPLVLSEFGGYCYVTPGHLFTPEKAYGYRSYPTQEKFQEALSKLYREKVLPRVKRGLCGAIYTQVSDVEDECNGLLSYDRAVCKVQEERMQALADALQKAIQEEL